MNKKIGIAGTGFSGAVLARELAEAGYQIDIFDERDHVAGNCHTQRDERTNVMLHVYGPHIFHTNNDLVWEYVNKFDEIMPFVNRVKAIHNDQVFSLPINLMTINQLFKKNLSPNEARIFLESISDKNIENPKTFEEQALCFLGNELYKAFFKEYTIKQWGIHPSKLPASILKRLPVRFSYDDNYYSSKYQGIPKNGYTYLIEKILNHKNIEVHLNNKFTKDMNGRYLHSFYTGPIDSWFNYDIGRLAYRSLRFEKEYHAGDFQGNAVINYCDSNEPWTRISEHKHFAPWETHSQTVIYKEYSFECGKDDIPYYPIRLENDKEMLLKYIQKAKKEKKVTFLGRLGTYRYLDMHITIEEALDVSKKFIKAAQSHGDIPAFFIDPI